MKTVNKKGSSAATAEDDIGLKTPVKNAEVEALGVLTRSQKKRLSTVAARTPNPKPLSKESDRATAKIKIATSNDSPERAKNCSNQDSESHSLQDLKDPNLKSEASKRRSLRIRQSIKQESEISQVDSKIASKLKSFGENDDKNSQLDKTKQFSRTSSNRDNQKVNSARKCKIKSSENKSLSDLDEMETNKIIANVIDSGKNINDTLKCNKICDVNKQNESICDKKNDSPNKKDTSFKGVSETTTPKEQLKTSKIENVKSDKVKRIISPESTASSRSKNSDFEDAFMSSSSQRTQIIAFSGKSSEDTKLISQHHPNLYVKSRNITPPVKTNDRNTGKEQSIALITENALPTKKRQSNSEKETNKNSPLLPDFLFKSFSVTEDSSSERSTHTDQSETKKNRTEQNFRLQFKKPKLNLSTSSVDKASHMVDKEHKRSYGSTDDKNSKIFTKKELRTFGRCEVKLSSPCIFTDRRKTVSNKEDVNESSESDSDAESRKAIMQSAQKRIIESISTSESESRKTVPPVTTLQNLKISSDSDSGPENVSFNMARQQSKDSFKEAVESIQREKRRKKEKRRERLEKYKQQKEEKLIRLKEKRASQEDASCSSSEESAFEEDEDAASLSKSTKASTTGEKENIDDALPKKRRKMDIINNKMEEKKSAGENKLDISENQAPEPCIGGLKKLADEILENLADTIPEMRKTDEKTRAEEKNRKEKHKNKTLKGSEDIKSMRDVDYIPLSTYGATEFGAVPLNKMLRAPKSIAQQAAEFRQQMLYGSHIKRMPGKVHLVYQQKLKAAGKDQYVR